MSTNTDKPQNEHYDQAPAQPEHRPQMQAGPGGDAVAAARALGYVESAHLLLMRACVELEASPWTSRIRSFESSAANLCADLEGAI
jgi:hypothetical protein